MLVTVPVGMVMSVIMIVGVIMSTATGLTMGMFMVMMMRSGIAMVMMMAFWPMFVGMFMRPMIVMVVTLGLAIPVGAAFRIEGREHGCDRGAKPLKHVLDDVIVANAQPIAEELSRQMPVAEMPGDAHEIGWAGSGNLKKPFRNRLDQDQTPILKLESIAVLHHGCFLEIEQEHGLADAAHHETATMTVVALKSKRVGRCSGPGTGGKDASGSNHGMSVLTDGGRDGWASLAKSVAEASAAIISTRPSSAAAATPEWWMIATKTTGATALPMF